jgi:hypothetical protein
VIRNPRTDAGAIPANGQNASATNACNNRIHSKGPQRITLFFLLGGRLIARGVLDRRKLQLPSLTGLCAQLI